MVLDRVQRRIAAIVAADVAGYSRLMGADEEGTLATLKVYREVIDGLIAHHGGRIFGSAGDSVIAEFASPVEAVRCATEIQLQIDERNAILPEPRRMRFRIGINLGDIIVDGDNLMGDGVNVAARLETLAMPGGICVSETIHTQVRDRLSLDFMDLGEHNVKNIVRPVHAYRVPLPSEAQTKSPFRGLEAFDVDHADLFFGRGHAIAICTERLEHLAASGNAFLLIYGMSGSGKSSLLRAGLLPAIARKDAISGAALWRRCIVRPSEASDPIMSLAAGLVRDDILSGLAEKKSPGKLAELFRTVPERTLPLIRSSLAKAGAAAGSPSPQARLVLAVDQMEELFAADTDPSSRAAFVRILAALAGSGFAWVIGTIRADFFHRCSEIPGFSALKDGLGSYELLPPTGPEIAQIIREPARATGLSFEEDPDRGRLDDVLQEAAVADRGSLPLLEFVLDALYEAGRGRRLLTFAAYRALGGLEGAIARRADEVVDALHSNVQDALPAVLRALTALHLGDEAIILRPAPLADVANAPARSALVDALIGARLLVSDENAEGRPVVRLAHEALLSRWPRARDIVNADRGFLETRTRLQTDAQRWHSDDQNPELLLPRGKRLAEGEELLLARREELGEQIVSYVEASSYAEREREEKDRQTERKLIESAEAAKRERLEREAERLVSEAERRDLAAAAATRLARRTRYAALVALALAVVAGTGALIGFRGQQEAKRQAEFAERSADLAKAAERQARAAEQTALQARNDALRNQSLSLSSLSQQAMAGGDSEAAVLLALEALPKDMNSPERPFSIEAAVALYQALSQNRQALVFRHDAGVTDAAFNLSGDRVVTSSYDRTARIWSVGDGSEVAVLKGHQEPLERATFSPDGTQVITAARDGTARIWNAVSGKQLFVIPLPGNFQTAMFSPDGTRVLTAAERHDPAIWDAQTGKQVTTVKDFPVLGFARFSPDGGSFAAASNSRSIHIWSTEDGKLIKTLVATGMWPNDVVFSPDGRRILSTSWNTNTYLLVSRLWDVSSGQEIARLGGHRNDTRSGAFSHDGRLVATVSIDGTARLWDGVTGRHFSLLGAESGGLNLSDVGVGIPDQEINAAFSPDDRFLATVSMDGSVHVWDVKSGLPFIIIRGHKGLVEHVAFSPEGSMLLTASHDGTARLWDVDGVLKTPLSHQHPPTFAAFSPDGNRIVTGGRNRVGHIWDVASGKEVVRFEAPGGALQDAAFSPDGRQIATASQNGSIVIWDSVSGQQIIRLKGHDSTIVEVKFNPQGDILMSTSTDGTARLWNASTGDQIAVLEAGGYLRKAVISTDGQYVLTALNDDSARIWRTDGSEYTRLVGHENRIAAAAFSSDGRLVATGSHDGTARIWSLPDGRTIAVLRGHTESLTDVAFSQDAQLIVTASRDRTARIWRVADGTEKAILRGHGAALSSAVFSPNGLYVVTASAADRTVRLWDTQSGREIALLTNKPSAEPALTHAEFNSDGTRIVIVSGEDAAQIIRVFPTPKDLIDYARAVIPRSLTPCERMRFFLAAQSETADCRN